MGRRKKRTKPVQASEEPERVFQELIGLYEKVYNYVCAQLRLSKNALEDAEDVIQQSYANAIEAITKGKFRGEASVKTWFWRIVVNQTIDRFRKQEQYGNLFASGISVGPSDEEGRSIDPADDIDETDPLAEAIQAELHERVLAAINSLGPEYRDTIFLRVYGALSYAEIANILGVEVGTVKSRIFRARETLAELLKEYQQV